MEKTPPKENHVVEVVDSKIVWLSPNGSWEPMAWQFHVDKRKLGNPTKVIARRRRDA